MGDQARHEARRGEKAGRLLEEPQLIEGRVGARPSLAPALVLLNRVQIVSLRLVHTVEVPVGVDIGGRLHGGGGDTAHPLLQRVGPGLGAHVAGQAQGIADPVGHPAEGGHVGAGQAGGLAHGRQLPERSGVIGHLPLFEATQVGLSQGELDEPVHAVACEVPQFGHHLLVAHLLPTGHIRVEQPRALRGPSQLERQDLGLVRRHERRAACGPDHNPVIVYARLGVRLAAQREPERGSLASGHIERLLLEHAARDRHGPRAAGTGKQQFRGHVPLTRTPAGPLGPEVHISHIRFAAARGRIRLDR